MEMEKQSPVAFWRSVFAGSAFTLTALGVVLIYSASCVRAAAGGGTDFAFLARQLIWLGLGAAGLCLAARLDLSRWKGAVWPLFLLTVLMLAAVRVPGVGTKVNGAYRWLRLGGFNMQPSELAKMAMVVAMAAFLARRPDKYLPFWRGLLPAGLLAALPVGLIMVEPDVGTSALIAAVALSMLVVGGGKVWQLLLAAAPAVPAAALFVLAKGDYIRERVSAWQSGSTEGAGYQPWMSKIALGSGGLTGMGLGAGPAKLYYLPEAHTDYIFAIAGQELGLCGTLGVMALFLAFVVAGLRLCRLAGDRFKALVIYGVTATIGLQAAFNMAVVTATIPPKGISLPFISFGGSGLCIALTAVGLVLGLTRPPKAAAPAAAPVVIYAMRKSA